MATTLAIPPKMTADSDENDRWSSGISAGQVFLNQAVILGQVFRVFFASSLLSVVAGVRCG